MELKRKIKQLAKLIKEPKIFSTLISLIDSDYLYEVGWFISFKAGEPINENYKPIPWVTYPFLDFIQERLDEKFEIFEFGSGNSTLFFAGRVKQVTSVEHNSEWYKKLKNKIPGNSNLILSISDGIEDYIAVLKQSNKKFDLIIIDGIHRVDCCLSASNYLTDNGVIILDDSKRDDYGKGIDHLVNKGFKKIDFTGIPPGTFIRKCTTVFYKTNNCLYI